MNLSMLWEMVKDREAWHATAHACMQEARNYRFDPWVGPGKPNHVPTRLFCPWDSLGKNAGVGCHFLLQGIFPTQGSNLSLLHSRQMLYRLSH